MVLIPPAAAQATDQPPPAANPAAQEIAIGPPPGWVVPTQSTAAESQGGSVARLIDLQSRFDERGTHVFTRSIVKFNTAAALQQATNLLIRWEPQLGSATVHTARILRDGKTIDLIAAGGRFSTIRQESGLEMGRLDGTLTAFMPIADLRVGDAIDYSYTVDRSNPALGGHSEFENFLQPGSHFDQLYLRQSWPKGAPVKLRTGPALPAAKTTEAGGFVTRTIGAENFTVPKIPDRGATRLMDRTVFQLTDFASWDEVAQVMRPHFDRGATLAATSPVKAEIARIAAGSADPMVRAGAALALVQRQVRYFADLQGLGGYVPMAADEVWAHRIGDCKGKTVLLVALLRGLGIDAAPALVSTTRGNGLDKSLPMPGRFDHVIVRARIADKDYWLDGTRMDDARIADLELPDFEWALPLDSAPARLVEIPAAEFKRPQTEWRLDLDVSAGLDVPARATGSGVVRGDRAQWLGQNLQLLDPAKQEEFLRKLWAARHDWVEIKTVTHTTDAERGEVRIGFTGTGKMEIDTTGEGAGSRYEANKARLGTNILADRKDTPDLGAPIAIARQYDLVSQTIILPDGGKGYFVDGEDIDEVIGGVHYTRVARISGNRFDMTATTRSSRSEITVARAKDADVASDALFAKRLFVHLPIGDADAALANNAARTEGKLIDLIDNGRFAEAGELLAAALAKTPRKAKLVALQARLDARLGRLTAADHGYDAALAIDRAEVLAILGKARILLGKGRTEDALLLLDRAILIAPDMDSYYRERATARIFAGDNDGALADLAILTSKDSAFDAARRVQVALLGRLARHDDAIAVARAYRKAAPGDPRAFYLLGSALLAAGRQDEALRLANAEQKGGRTALGQQFKLAYGLSGTPAQALADMLSAVALDPASRLTPGALGLLARDKEALAKVTAAYAAAQARPDLDAEAVSYALAQVRLASGDPAPLLEALSTSEARSPAKAEVRNNACWVRATHGIDLSAARASCEAAIGIVRQPAYVDSLAMVELRSGNYPAAIRLYDEMLQSLPDSAPSLFARGIARLRSGDKPGGEADIERARRIDPFIDIEFADYGLKP